MGKNSGGTRSGNSGNPTGAGATRSTANRNGEPLPVTGVLRSFRDARLTDVRDNVALVNFLGRWAANPFDLKDGTFAMQFSERMPDTGRENASKLERDLGIEIVAVDKVDNFIRFRFKEQRGNQQEISINQLPAVIRGQQNRFYEEAKKEFARGEFGRGGAGSTNGSRLYDLGEVLRDANRTESQYIQMALRGDKEAQRIVARARARRRAANEMM